MPRIAKLTAKLPDAIPKPASLAGGWFAQQSWQPFEFQREVWAHMAAGRSGVLHASTGSGKTYAVWFGAVMRTLALEDYPPIKNAVVADRHAFRATTSIVVKKNAPPLAIVWLTPMRALAADTAFALSAPLPALGLNWTVGQRTGDTPAAERARQDKRLPTALVTTPESLTLLLTRASARDDFKQLSVVIVDEWHELLGSKRGVQTQLALARLKMWHPELVVWGLSATLGNLNDACAALTGQAPGTAPHSPVLVRGKTIKHLTIDTLLPAEVGRFPWGGHLGLQMLQPVIAEIEQSASTLVFTNTRSQAELWYQQLLTARPDWAGVIALHHGSLDKEVRAWVEAGLKSGALKAVVATSSLDLGVDFAPVERVLQIGSAKGVARLLQRAGRSGHSPGRASRITLVPTNSLELIEAAAVRNAALAGKVESREAPDKPLDVLVQHLVSMALSTGFLADEMYAEVCSAWSYRTLSRGEFDWALAFIERGGECLQAYAEYQRAAPDAHDVWRVASAQIARRHRMAIGTITSDASMRIKYLSGANVGTVEESFIARLRKGDCFLFGGRLLEYLRTQDMTAYVKKATKNKGAVPRWGGGNMPLSTELADAMLATFGRVEQGDAAEPELHAVRELIATQRAWSALPTPQTLLVEQWQSREGQHVFIYPFAGRNVHLGLASLIAYRLAKDAPNTFSISVNDYGFELQSAAPIDVSAITSLAVFSEANLLADVLASLNASELAQRRFRGIARVAGLVFSGYPGAPKSSKQLQASSGLFYEVFRTYDPGNRLLAQAQTEVLSQELEIGRMTQTLQRLHGLQLVFKTLERPSPLCFGLLVARLREKLSTEKLSDRVQRLLKELEMAAYS